ncbi:SUKH-3 domain-containing protein [Luedemannella helvata]|uniref:SUKH-3 immunity protein n=1 Tax=Luedemannella helvata TaxID=349315 RepID=A0ABP4W1J1_9ACTN
MVTREDAVNRVRDWWADHDRVVGDANIGVHEFDLGFVVWEVSPPPGTGAGPTIEGGTRVVVDRSTGDLSTWPSRPPRFVADMYRTFHEARERFPADVYDDLAAAGWRPGRDVSVAVDGWLQRTGIDRELPLFDAARRVLTEFGGLTVAQRGPTGKPGGGFASHFYPARHAPTTPEIREFAGIIGARVFPVGSNEDGPSHLVVDERGRMFQLHPVADLFLGDTVDEALTWVTRGGERPAVDDAGRWTPTA